MTAKKLFDLAGKVALVTGGSRGLGLQMAEALGEMGCKVVIMARHVDELAAASSYLSNLAIQCSVQVNDLTAFDRIPAMVDEALSQYGTIDILVNNAGTIEWGPAENFTDEAWNKDMDLNINAMFFLSREVGKKVMIPKMSGKIVNIASTAGLAGGSPQINCIAYRASKGAVVNFTRGLASEWGKYNINVNAICPGFFRSTMSAGMLSKVEEALVAQTPLHRLGGQEDLKGAVVFLASEASRHVTGQYIAVDGGKAIV